MERGLVPFLNMELKRRGWKKSDLARQSGLSGGTVYDVFKKPDSVPDAETMYKLAEALDLHWTVLYELCGYPPETPGPNMTLEELTRALSHDFPLLSQAFQDALLLEEVDRNGLLALARAYWRMSQANKAQADE